MNINEQPTKFEPVIISLVSESEVQAFWNIVGTAKCADELQNKLKTELLTYFETRDMRR